ncbi:MAG: hypothetical protein IPH31_21950 [Lewinellaceae bacterium]|nr:hypothetical protein [Lewinellaceae bacterium]
MAGFFGKYFLFTAAFAKYPWLVVLTVINSAISIYYYFKIIVAAYFTKKPRCSWERCHIRTCRNSMGGFCRINTHCFNDHYARKRLFVDLICC